MRMKNPVHPGIILKAALGEMNVTEAANHLMVTRTTLSQILNGHAGISAGMALRLEKLFGNPGEFWLDLQKQYELAQARNTEAPQIKRIRPINQVAHA